MDWFGNWQQNANGVSSYNNGIMDNVNTSLNSVGSIMSLANAWDNWQNRGLRRDALRTNLASVKQAMDQSREGFQFDMQRQRDSLAAIAAANYAAAQRQGG